MILTSLSILALTAVCCSFTSDDETPKTITICHVPPGNPDNCQEITISVNALDAHIDHHGDRLVCHNPNDIIFYDHLSRTFNMAVITEY